MFDQREFVTKVLVRAYEAGDECFRRACQHFRHCTTCHGRERVGGGPFPQDVTLQERAKASCDVLRRGSPEYRFYDSLFRDAEANIRDEQVRDEELAG